MCSLGLGSRLWRRDYGLLLLRYLGVVSKCERGLGRIIPREAPVMIASLPSRGRYPWTPPRFVAAVRVRRDSMVY